PASSAPLRATTSMSMPRSGDPAWTAHAPAASTPPRSTLGAGAPVPPAPAFAAQTPIASGPWHSPSGERSPTLSLADSLESAPSSARSVFQTPAEALELAERTPRAESDWHEDTLAARGRGRRRFFKALGLLAVLAGGAALWHWRGTVSRELLATTGIRLPAPRLTIQSQPPGATVSVEGKDVGTTPLSVDNLYPDQVLSVQVRLKGYRTWKGTFRGGQPVELQVTLEP
ncbi:PEGA domain-containing protein, partial [Pyxidicoccus sp. 3LG]